MKKFILSILLIICTEAQAQKYNNTPMLGVKYYVFNDWKLDYLRPTLFAFKYDYKLSSKAFLDCDWDFFDLSTAVIDRQNNRLERISAAYWKDRVSGRNFWSIGVQYNYSLWNGIYAGSGIRYRHGYQRKIIDYIVHNPVSTTITTIEPSNNSLGGQFSFGYKYSFLKKRLIISVDYTGQLFYRSPYYQSSFGAFCGYSFKS